MIRYGVKLALFWMRYLRAWIGIVVVLFLMSSQVLAVGQDDAEITFGAHARGITANSDLVQVDLQILNADVVHMYTSAISSTASGTHTIDVPEMNDEGTDPGNTEVNVTIGPWAGSWALPVEWNAVNIEGIVVEVPEGTAPVLCHIYFKYIENTPQYTSHTFTLTGGPDGGGGGGGGGNGTVTITQSSTTGWGASEVTISPQYGDTFITPYVISGGANGPYTIDSDDGWEGDNSFAGHLILRYYPDGRTGAGNVTKPYTHHYWIGPVQSATIDLGYVTNLLPVGTANGGNIEWGAVGSVDFTGSIPSGSLHIQVGSAHFYLKGGEALSAQQLSGFNTSGSIYVSYRREGESLYNTPILITSSGSQKNSLTFSVSGDSVRVANNGGSPVEVGTMTASSTPGGGGSNNNSNFAEFVKLSDQHSAETGTEYPALAAGNGPGTVTVPKVFGANIRSLKYTVLDAAGCWLAGIASPPEGLTTVGYTTVDGRQTDGVTAGLEDVRGGQLWPVAPNDERPLLWGEDGYEYTAALLPGGVSHTVLVFADLQPHRIRVAVTFNDGTTGTLVTKLRTTSGNLYTEGGEPPGGIVGGLSTGTAGVQSFAAPNPTFNLPSPSLSVPSDQNGYSLALNIPNPWGAAWAMSIPTMPDTETPMGAALDLLRIACRSLMACLMGFKGLAVMRQSFERVL